MSLPCVSVLIPVYNGAAYLQEALARIHNQTFTDYECIVVDDGSQDASKAIAEDFCSKDVRFRVLSRKNTGIVGALNDGLKLCKGKYVARMDADDISLPNRFERQVQYLENNTDCVGVGSWVLFVDPDNRPLLRYQPDTAWDSVSEQLSGGTIAGLIHPVMMLRNDCLKSLAGYRIKAEWVEDFDLYLRMSRVGRLAILPEILLRYRQHPLSVNSTKNASLRRDRKNEILREHFQSTEMQPINLPQPVREKNIERQWAYWAAQDGYFRSAFHWNLRDIFKHPFCLESWRSFNYTLKRTSGMIPGSD